MTDKEQILIDGCKVEECTNFRDEVGIGYFKQLAHKTQECDRYRKTLEEIDEMIKEDDCTNCREHYYNQHCADYDKGNILDIINKAKGEKKCQ